MKISCTCTEKNKTVVKDKDAAQEIFKIFLSITGILKKVTKLSV